MWQWSEGKIQETWQSQRLHNPLPECLTVHMLLQLPPHPLLISQWKLFGCNQLILIQTFQLTWFFDRSGFLVSPGLSMLGLRLMSESCFKFIFMSLLCFWSHLFFLLPSLHFMSHFLYHQLLTYSCSIIMLIYISIKIHAFSYFVIT